MVEIRPITVFEWRVEWLRQQRNRPELMKYFRQSEPIKYMDQLRWFNSLDKKNVRLFAVTIGSVDPKIVGYVGLNPIDWRHNHAEFGIFIIPEEHDKGYGSEAMKLLLEYSFKRLKLHKVYSDVLEYAGENTFKFYENLKFKPEGKNRQHYLKDGKWVDSISFSMLDNEYEKNKHLLEPGKSEKANSELVKA